MQVRSWHPGKLALLWGLSLAVLVLLLFARPDRCNDVTLALWLLLIVPLLRWTWDWFGAKETATSEAPRSTEDDHESRTPFLGNGIVNLIWIVVTVMLLLVYFDC